MDISLKDKLNKIEEHFKIITKEELEVNLQKAGLGLESAYSNIEDQMLDKYEWTLYITNELLKCELEELSNDWNTSIIKSYKRGRADTYKETLYHLTGDEKWMKSLEELKEIIKE